MSTTHQGGTRLAGITAHSTAEQPLVSIVTVVFNGAATLPFTMESVFGQSYPNIEYIAVDGGSTDGTVDLLRANDHRISYWVSERDKGIYDAMNKGISLCTGEWVGLINADDRYALDAVQRVVDAVRSLPGINVVHGDIWLEFPGGQRTLKRARNSAFLLKYWEMVLNHPSFFVRRSFYHGRPFDEKLKVSADHKWTYMAYRDHGESFLYLPVPMAHFAVGGASMSVPLRKVLKEGRQVCRDLGMGPLSTLLGLAVRTALYPLQHLKLWYNRTLAGKPAGTA